MNSARVELRIARGALSRNGSSCGRSPRAKNTLSYGALARSQPSNWVKSGWVGLRFRATRL